MYFYSTRQREVGSGQVQDGAGSGVACLPVKGQWRPDTEGENQKEPRMGSRCPRSHGLYCLPPAFYL